MTALLLAALSFQAPETSDLRCVVVVPPGGRPYPDARDRLDRTLKDIQWWYACQMRAYGYGPKTFDFETDAKGRLVVNYAPLDAVPPTDPGKLRDLVSKACEGVLGDKLARRGTVMLMVYADYSWTDRSKFEIASEGSTIRGFRINLNAWHFYNDNPAGWRDPTPVPRLPLDNPYFSPLHTRVLQAFVGDGVRTVAERTSMGYGAIAHEIGHAFGLHHPDRKFTRIKGDVMDGQFRHMQGNFLADLPRDWCCLSPQDAAVLNANPRLKVFPLSPPSTGAPDVVGGRGADPSFVPEPRTSPPRREEPEVTERSILRSGNR